MIILFHIQIEPGLGESELFYSILISALNVGGAVGGIASGLLGRCVPYWYLFLTALISHTVAFVIYCLSYQGWLMMISRILSGYFDGAIITLAFNYCTRSSEEYVQLRKELGKKTDEKSSIQLRNLLFAVVSFGYTFGIMLSAGEFLVNLLYM